MFKFPSGAGYQDYEDVGQSFNDMCEIKYVSDCCGSAVYLPSNRCLQCFHRCDVLEYVVEPTFNEYDDTEIQ